MFFIVLIVLAFILFISPVVRCAAFHPVNVAKYAASDFSSYVKHKEFNRCGSGELVAYTGLFGKGKTLSAVHKVVSAYKAYDGKLVWCPRRQQLVTQRIHIISNVSLSVPYEDLKSLTQIIYAAQNNKEMDDFNGTLTVTLVLADEMSVQMNSRQFKSNIDPLFLNTLLTCRHYYLSIYYTTQRFGHVDALLRQVTSYVVDCDKLWRFQRLNYYDAWDLENASSPRLVAPQSRGCWFVTKQDYENYDTLACVGNLQKSCKEGDFLSEEEILKLQQNTQEINMEGVKPSKYWQRLRKRMNKK